MRRKKGQIWISAVIYIALGIVALTLIINAGIPLINKMKDKNTIIQTKDLMFSLDENIRTVVSEGPGSRRYLSPFDIKRGELFIDVEDSNEILWKLDTKLAYMEEGVVKKEGGLNLFLDPNTVEGATIRGEYVMNLQLKYENLDIALESTYGNPFSGSYSLSIEHTGEYDETTNKPKILLKVI